MGRDIVQLETVVSTISQEYLLEFTSEYGISKALHLKLPGPEDRIVDFPEGKVGVYTKFFEFANFRFPLSQFLFDILGYYQIYLSQLSVIGAAKVKTGSRPRAAHEVPLLTVTSNRVIEIEDPTAATNSSGETATSEMPPLKNVTNMGGAPEAGPTERVAATDPPTVKEHHKRGHDGVDTNAPPKVLRRVHADPRPTESTREGKSLAAIELGMGSTRPTPAPQGAPVDVSNPDPLSFADPQSRPSADIAQSSQGAATVGDLESENTSFASMVGENEIKNLETLLEAEADIKKAAEDKSAELSQELENMRALFSDLQAAFEEFKQYEDNRVEQRCVEMDARLDALSIDFDEELYPHMLIAIAGRRWMIGRGLRLAMMKCGESIELREAFANVVSARIAKGMSKGLKHEVKHGQAKLDLEAIEAYDPEAEAKYIAALHALKNLKYPLVDQLKSMKDAPMDVIMASLHLESDTRDDAPEWVRELRPSTSQLTIPGYPEVRDPMDPWACKEEILLADAIAANVSRAKKKKKCRVVCRTHGVGFAHHARSDGVSVSVLTIAPQGLAILLADAATQTETSDEASPQLLRSSSLPVING
uniref:Transposase (Putative), gypsy type n=1 Tax=Tanacetum cinerariifolium TaxID=118510 RepID=A0A6L2J0Z3_TANCI|nr:transposase (putative), gypsy type [Tanacetum cinerariifolium]